MESIGIRTNQDGWLYTLTLEVGGVTLEGMGDTLPDALRDLADTFDALYNSL